jgi:hypothetical protein
MPVLVIQATGRVADQQPVVWLPTGELLGDRCQRPTLGD